MSFRTIPGLPPQFELKTDAEKWQGAFKAAQGAIREQGQVMSAALDNNRSLWETNKKLRRERMDILATCARLERERNELQTKLESIPAEVLGRSELQHENDQLRDANATLRAELGRMLTPELDSEALRARMEELKKQGAELRATGLVPTQEELDERDRNGSLMPLRPHESGADFEKRMELDKQAELAASQLDWDRRAQHQSHLSRGLLGEAYQRSFDHLGKRPGS